MPSFKTTVLSMALVAIRASAAPLDNSCDVNSDCAVQSVCIQSSCEPRRDCTKKLDCSPDEACLAAPGSVDPLKDMYCQPPPEIEARDESCDLNSDCAVQSVCIENTCEPRRDCTKKLDCSPDEACLAAPGSVDPLMDMYCQPPPEIEVRSESCDVNSDCAVQSVCIQSVCEPRVDCTKKLDCSPDEACLAAPGSVDPLKDMYCQPPPEIKLLSDSCDVNSDCAVQSVCIESSCEARRDCTKKADCEPEEACLAAPGSVDPLKDMYCQPPPSN